MVREGALDAVVWRRSDFSESSRIVTLLTREHGKLRAFAKGAHRADSVLLGKMDYLNLVRVELWRRGETMPLLARAELVHEPRGLREPARFLVADHLVELIDEALPDDRRDPTLWDLLQGGLTLLERCPLPALAAVMLGLEWRFLAALGLQPDVDVCADTGAQLPPNADVVLAAAGRGFVAQGAAPAGIRAITAATRDVLRTLGVTPGKQWPALALAGDPVHSAFVLVGRLVAHGIERPPRARAAAARAALQALAGGG